MRDYSKSAPTFWTGDTGRKIRAAGRDVQVIAFYLYTCPNSNWIGLYYLPLPTLCHEVGISEEGAIKALRSLKEMDFAYYDDNSEIAWVPGSAKFQVGENLKAGDLRIKGIVKDLQQYIKSPFCSDFYKRYSKIYHLPEIEFPEQNSKPLDSPFEGPSKPVTETVVGAVAVIGAVIGAVDCAQSDKKQSLHAPASPVFLQIPLVDKTSYPICKCQVDEWKELYPAVDVEQELRNYLGWTLSHPTQRKTRTGILKSINFWLSDKQNKGGKGNGTSPADNSRRDGGFPKFEPDEDPGYLTKK